MSTKYLNNRLKYHAASRVASQQTDALLQSLTLDGHSVTTKKVWASNRFPVNTTEWKTKKNSVKCTEDLVAVFKALPGTVSTDITGGGKKWTNPNYDVTLYENVKLSPVEGSNGVGQYFEAYEFLENGLRVQDWVSPMAAFDPSINAPIPGFAGLFQATKSTSDTGWKDLLEDSEWVQAAGTWQFMYIGGILTFNAANTPAYKGYKQIRMTAFAYTGKYLDSVISDIILSGGGSSAQISELSGKFNSFTTGLTSLEAIKLSGDLSGKTFYLGLAPSSALAQSADGLKSTLRIEKLGTATSGYAASYQLKDAVGNAFGDTINIVKDQFLKDVKFVPAATQADVDEATAAGCEITLGGPFIKFTFDVTGGGQKKVFIDMTKLVDTYTGVSGVTVSGYTIAGVRDSASEDFFKLTADGFKVVGVSAAINDALTGSQAYTDTASGYIIKDGSFADHTVSLSRFNGTTGVTIPGIAASGEVISGITGVTDSHTIVITNKNNATFTALDVAKDSEVAKSAFFDKSTHITTYKNSDGTQLYAVSGIAASGEIISGGSFADHTVSLKHYDTTINDVKVEGIAASGQITDKAEFNKADHIAIFTRKDTTTYELSGIAASGQITDKAEFNKADHIAIFTRKDTTTYELSGIAASGQITDKAEFNKADHIATFTRKDTTTYQLGGIAASGEIISGGSFNSSNGQLTLKFKEESNNVTITGLVKPGDITNLASGKMDKLPSGYTADNIVTVSGMGNVKDSGYKLNTLADLTDLSGTFPSQRVVSGFVDSKINALNYADTAVTDEYVTQVDETNGKIAVKRGKVATSGVIRVATTNVSGDTAEKALQGLGDWLAKVDGDETVDGSWKKALKAEETARKNADNYLSGVISGAVGAGDYVIVSKAGKIEKSIYVINGTADLTDLSGTIPSQHVVSGFVDKKIKELDVDEISSFGKPIIAVSETDGKVSAAYGTITSNNVIYETTKANGNVSGQLNTINAALTGYLGVSAVQTEFKNVYDAIDKVSGAAIDVSGKEAIVVTPTGTNRQIKLNINPNDKILSQSAAGLSATFSLKKLESGIASGNASEYILTDKNGNQIGDKIEIYKDQFLSGVVLVEDPTVPGNFYLRFTFKLANDNPKTIDVPLSGMFHEYEGKSGVDVQPDGNKFTISGVVDKSSDGYFTVGPDGFKVAGVSAAIDNAIAHTDTASGYIVKEGSFSRTTGDLTLTRFNGGTIPISGLIKESDISDLASGKMDKVANHADELVTLSGTEGNAKASGYKLGTDSDTLSSATTAKLVATEVAVKNALTGLQAYGDATYMNQMSAAADGQIIIGGSTADTVEGSGFTLGADTDVLSGALSGITANKVATEKAVKKYVDDCLTWETLS